MLPFGRPLTALLLAPAALVACSAPAQRDSLSPAGQRATWFGDSPAPASAPEPATESGADFDGASPAPRARADQADKSARQPAARPGLGTEWGETRSSRITTSPFVRADAKNPFATAALFYNDEEGARATATTVGFKRSSEGGVDVGGGILTARIKDGSGSFLTGFEAGGKNFVVGTAGERYSIVLQSHVPARLEVVVSVDGLDVIDGRAASFSKRGYLVDPHGSVEIDGFRQNLEQVAAFRFGAVRESYAEKKHGDARNVGVIGIAVFNEQGSNPRTWSFGEVNRRLDANPFPGQFATPP